MTEDPGKLADVGWTVEGGAGTLFEVMANAIRVHTTVESDTLVIPELLPFVGKKIEVIVVEDEEGAAPGERVAAPEAPPKRILGSLRGQLKVPDDFDDPLPEDILRAFEGE